jgi:hypothetical protein
MKKSKTGALRNIRKMLVRAKLSAEATRARGAKEENTEVKKYR